MQARRDNFGSLFTEQPAVRLTTLTAGGAGDNTEIIGPAVDRKLPLANGIHDSVIFEIAIVATIANTKALNVIGTIEHSDDGSTNWTAVPNASQPSGAAGGSVGSVAGNAGGTIQDAVLVLDVLKVPSMKQFVRLRITPDLTAANTDTAIIGAVAIVGGAQNLPE